MLHKCMHTCIFACVSNVTCLTSYGENVWDLLNVHCKRLYEKSVEHSDYIDILQVLGLTYHWCGTKLVIYIDM